MIIFKKKSIKITEYNNNEKEQSPSKEKNNKNSNEKLSKSIYSGFYIECKEHKKLVINITKTSELSSKHVKL